MEERDISFESADSKDLELKESSENKENSTNLNLPKNEKDNTNIINQNKNQIKKSILFSNNNSNITNDNDFFKASILKNNNIISNLFPENKNSGLNNIENLSNININNNKKKLSCLDISDKNSTKITLVKIIDQYYYEGHLKLKNNLKSEYVIFKVINDKPFYSITPTLYYIEPEKEITINIKRFERMTINETKNVYDFLVIVVTHTKNKIEDVNDAKIYIRKEDLYSPEYQLYTFSINLDYGYNPKIYKKEVEERENILNKYNNQLNMNNISDSDEVKTHIERVKKEIKEYEDKINNIVDNVECTKNKLLKLVDDREFEIKNTLDNKTIELSKLIEENKKLKEENKYHKLNLIKIRNERDNNVKQNEQIQKNENKNNSYINNNEINNLKEEIKKLKIENDNLKNQIKKFEKIIHNKINTNFTSIKNTY